MPQPLKSMQRLPIVIRGLPIERDTDEEAAIINSGLGINMGVQVSLNVRRPLCDTNPALYRWLSVSTALTDHEAEPHFRIQDF